MSLEDYYGEPISKYTSEQATDDGFLLDLSTLPLKPKNGVFSHITTNLLGKGYWNQDKTLNIPNIIDLLNQALRIMRLRAKDWFYSGKIELPSGVEQKIFIAQNETGKYTIMLPEDY